MDLSTAKIYLRPMTEDDTEMILRWRNSAFVKKFFIYQKNITPEEHLDWIRTKVNTGSVYQFVIHEKNGNPIGSVYIQKVDPVLKQAEYGIFIGEHDSCGKGYGTDAARLMIRFAFEQLKLQTLYLRVLADNCRAIRSYEHVGFRVVESGSQVEINGKLVDLVMMTISRKE